MNGYRDSPDVEFRHMLKIYNLLGDPALEIQAVQAPSDDIFSDGFESGGLTGWSSQLP